MVYGVDIGSDKLKNVDRILLKTQYENLMQTVDNSASAIAEVGKQLAQTDSNQKNLQPSEYMRIAQKMISSGDKSTMIQESRLRLEQLEQKKQEWLKQEEEAEQSRLRLEQLQQQQQEAEQEAEKQKMLTPKTDFTFGKAALMIGKQWWNRMKDQTADETILIDNYLREKIARKLIGGFSCEKVFESTLCDLILSYLVVTMFLAEVDYLKSWDTVTDEDLEKAENEYLQSVQRSIVSFFKEGLKNLANDKASQEAITGLYNEILSSLSAAYMFGQEQAVLKLVSTMTTAQAQSMKHKIAMHGATKFKTFTSGLFKSKLANYTSESQVKQAVENKNALIVQQGGSAVKLIQKAYRMVSNFISGKTDEFNVTQQDVTQQDVIQPEPQTEVPIKPTIQEFIQAKVEYTGNPEFATLPLTEFELSQTYESAETSADMVQTKPIKFEFTFEDIQKFQGPAAQTYKYLQQSYANLTTISYKQVQEDMFGYIASKINEAYSVKQDASTFERLQSWMDRQDMTKVFLNSSNEIVSKVGKIVKTMPEQVQPFFDGMETLQSNIEEATVKFSKASSAHMDSLDGITNTVGSGVMLLFGFVWIASVILAVGFTTKKGINALRSLSWNKAFSFIVMYVMLVDQTLQGGGVYDRPF